MSVSVWDGVVRVAAIDKSLAAVDSVCHSLTISTDDNGLKTIDPYEVVYYIRSGIQQFVCEGRLNVSGVCMSIMPGYLMTWDTDTCRLLSPCYCPNNTVSSSLYQRYRYSTVYELGSVHLNAINTNGNVLLNAWAIMDAHGKGFGSGVMITGLDVWLKYVMCGTNDASLTSTPAMMQELMFEDRYDEPLMKALGIPLHVLPELSNDSSGITFGFSPLSDGVPMVHCESAVQLLEQALSAYTSRPIAGVLLTKSHHICVQNMSPSIMGPTSWIRMVGFAPFYDRFRLGRYSPVTVGLDDIKSQLIVPLSPCTEFYSQSYHVLNGNDFSPEYLSKMAIIQVIMMIKRQLVQLERANTPSLINQVLISSHEWPVGALQLCVDICQVSATELMVSHWQDLGHVIACINKGEFFSESVKKQVFGVSKEYVPDLDPLTSFSLYQEWDDWFDRLQNQPLTWNTGSN